MPKPVDYDLSQISAHVITYSDRIQRGTKEDRATPACTAALAEAGLGPVSVAAIPESADILETEIRDALEAGVRFILVLGGSGFGMGNYAPEVVRSIIEVEIPGIAEQIRTHGLTNTPLSGLSREVVGVTARDSSGALIIPRSGHAPAQGDLPPARRTALIPPPSPLPLIVARNLDHLTFVRYLENRRISTMRFQDLKGLHGNYVRHLWGTMPEARGGTLECGFSSGRRFVRMTLSPTYHRRRKSSHQATSSGVSMSRHTSAFTFTRSTSRARSTRRTPTPRTDPRQATASSRTRRSAPAR